MGQLTYWQVASWGTSGCSWLKNERAPACLRRSSEGSPEQSSSWRALHSWLPPSSSYTACSSSSTSSSLLLDGDSSGKVWCVAKLSYLIVGGWSLLLRLEEKIQFTRVLPSRRLDNQRFPVISDIAYISSGYQLLGILGGLFSMPNIKDGPLN